MVRGVRRRRNVVRFSHLSLGSSDIGFDRKRDGQDDAVIRRGSPAEASPEQRRVLDDRADSAEAQATAENFPVALRILPRRARENLMHTYRYARFVDDVGDAAVGALLDAVEADVLALWTGGARLAPVTGLAGLVADGLPVQPLLDLIHANRMDQ